MKLTGVDKKYVEFIKDSSFIINDLMLNDCELEEFLKILEECKNRYSGKIRIGIPLMGDSAHKCNAGLEKLNIKFDGSILPCPAFKELSSKK